jgi:GNAT superfamily N-acetyltransferase
MAPARRRVSHSPLGPPLDDDPPPDRDPRADVPDHFLGIIALYRAHGWTHAGDPERLRTAIERSSYSVVALEDERVVGFARAMSDEAFAVYIADVLVAPDRQRMGIGRTLAEAIMEHYPMDRFHHQVLVAERGAEGFYRKLGMVPVTAYGLTAFIRARR